MKKILFSVILVLSFYAITAAAAAPAAVTLPNEIITKIIVETITNCTTEKEVAHQVAKLRAVNKEFRALLTNDFVAYHLIMAGQGDFIAPFKILHNPYCIAVNYHSVAGVRALTEAKIGSINKAPLLPIPYSIYENKPGYTNSKLFEFVTVAPPLHFAVLNLDANVTAALIDHGATFTEAREALTDTIAENPLQFLARAKIDTQRKKCALQDNIRRIIKMLLSIGGTLNPEEGRTFLAEAIYYRSVRIPCSPCEFSKYLGRRNIEWHTLDPIEVSIALDLIRIGLEEGADPNKPFPGYGFFKQSRLPLVLAAQSEQEDVVHLLLAHGANLDAALANIDQDPYENLSLEKKLLIQYASRAPVIKHAPVGASAGTSGSGGSAAAASL